MIATLNGYPDRPPQLVDHTGRPFRDDNINPPLSRPGEAIPHVLSFAAIMGGAWRTYWHGQFDEAMRHSADDALVMKRDCFLMGLLQERKLAVASTKWHLEVDDEKDPTQKAVKDEMTKIVRRIPHFKKLRMTLLEGLWYGRYGSQCTWKWRDPDGYRALHLRSHKPVNGDKIGYRYDDTPYVLINQAYRDQVPGAETVPIAGGRGGLGLLLKGSWRERVIIHQHEIDDADYWEIEQADAVHGVGIRSRVFWMDWLKREWLAWVCDWYERVGLGVTIFYYTHGNAEEEKQAEQAAHEQNRRGVILWPRFPGDRSSAGGVERLETPTGGAEALLKMQEHLEEIIERYVVGQTLSSDTEGSGLGGTGVAKMHSNTKLMITKFDAENLDETMTGTEDEPGIINTIQKWTFPQAKFPVRFVSDVPDGEAKDKIASIVSLAGLGLDFVKNEARQLTGLSDPQPGDDTFGGTPEALPGMPGEEEDGPGPGQWEEEEGWGDKDEEEPEKPSGGSNGSPVKSGRHGSEPAKRFTRDASGHEHDHHSGRFTGPGSGHATGHGHPAVKRRLEAAKGPVETLKAYYESAPDLADITLTTGKSPHDEVIKHVEEIVRAMTPEGVHQAARDLGIARTFGSREEAAKAIRQKISGRIGSNERAPIGSEQPRRDKREAQARIDEATRFVREEGPERYAFEEEEHPRVEGGEHGGEFAEKGGTATTTEKPAKAPKKPKAVKPVKEAKPARAAPGSQMGEEVKTKLREAGMVGTFPPAAVPMENVKVADLSADPDKLKFQELMQWDQKTKSGRISRQYRYTQEFHDRNAAQKFERVAVIEPYLEKIGESLTKQMEDESLSQREWEAAAIASVIRETGLRPTDGADSVKHGHFGISSLQARHLTVKGEEVHLDFIGKEGVRNQTVVKEPGNVHFLKEAVGRSKGDEGFIFQEATSDDAGDVLKNASLEAGGPRDIKIKDLRTLKATQTARQVVESYAGPPPPLTGKKEKDVKLVQKAILAMSGEVAKVLNNTPTQARDNYIHPEIWKTWQVKLATRSAAE